MSLSDKTWKVAPVSVLDQYLNPTWKSIGVWHNNWICAASFDDENLARRLCEMLNDTQTPQLPKFHENNDDVTNKRLATTIKLFCLQENLTWFDLGYDEEAIRNVNKFLEMPLDLRQAS